MPTSIQTPSKNAAKSDAVSDVYGRDRRTYVSKNYYFLGNDKLQAL